jgi:GTP-binding protein Era
MAESPLAPAFRCGHVAIVGRPNVGKSTLLNRMVGEKLSITSKKAQTTRHRVTGILTAADAQLVFVDTPGFQTRHRSRLNERMNRAVTQSLADVDAVLLVVEAGRTVPADRAVVALLPPKTRVVVAQNKVDLLADKNALLPQMAELAALRDFAAIVPVSAGNGDAVDLLTAEVRTLLPESPPLFDPMSGSSPRSSSVKRSSACWARRCRTRRPSSSTDSRSTATCAGSRRRSTSSGTASARSCSAPEAAG